MGNTTVVVQSVALEPQDIETITKLAFDKGLGSRGFSAALRMIIREWKEIQKPTEGKRVVVIGNNDLMVVDPEFARKGCVE
jgi:hypothetical protein